MGVPRRPRPDGRRRVPLPGSGAAADLILVGGANVFPAEVEAALAAHPRVLSSCVIGLPDVGLGERVHAIVQLDGAVSDDELRAHVAARLVGGKVPTSFERVDAPLREDTGEIRRSALGAARVRAGQTATATP